MNPQEFASTIRKKYPGAYDQVDDSTLTQKILEKYPQYGSQVTMGPPQAEKKGIGQTIWDALGVPEQKSREGLQSLAQMVPEGKVTGNMAADLARGTPRILANSIAEAAPGFVSRGSILTAGGARGLQGTGKLIAPMAKGLASQLESLSGISPKAEGALTEAYKDSSLIFGKGKKAAQALYEEGKSASRSLPIQATGKFKNGIYEFPDIKKIEELKKVVQGVNKHDKIVAAAEELAKTNSLHPDEALTARKSVDEMIRKKSAPLDNLFERRKMFDDIAKSEGKINEGDIAHKRGIMAEALRKLLPQNKYGGTSAFKLYIAEHLPSFLKVLLSPAAMGAGATGAGVAARNVVQPLIQSPKSAAAVAALLQRRKMNDENTDPQ